jgi:hypothetical protein
LLFGKPNFLCYKKKNTLIFYILSHEINVYLYFFIGADQLRPWGIVQSYCCGLSRLTRKRFQKTFPIIPFFDTSYTNTKNRDSSNHDLSLAEENELRINNLELFLREYVVDVHYLDGIRNKLVKSGETSNSATDTMNNLNNQAIQI